LCVYYQYIQWQVKAGGIGEMILQIYVKTV